MLFACIHVPDFPVQAALCAEPHSGGVALLDGPDSQLKVFSCNPQARSAGVEIGMTKVEAEVCPGVDLRKRTVEHEVAAQESLIECGFGFSPKIESTCPGTVILDLTGAERLWGSSETMAAQLLDRARQCEFAANVAIAANPDAALCAAHGMTGVTVIAAGDEGRVLGKLPVEVLQAAPEVLDTFDSWGIRDFKSLASLPPVPLTQRLGQYGLHLQRLAKGEVQRELVPVAPPPRFCESTELEEAVELLEPLCFVLNRMLDDLTLRLRERSLATDHIQIDLTLEINPDRDLRSALPPGSTTALHQRTLKLPVPVQDSKVLLKLLHLDLAAHPPQAPVKKISIEAFAARIRTTQAGLFQPLAPEPAKLEITMARLRAVVGETDSAGRGRVGFPVTLDTHTPDSFEVLPCGAFDPKAVDPKAAPPENAPAAGPALRLFRPAIAAKVELHNGAPLAVFFHLRRSKVIHAAGPWRSSGTWWDAAANWNRDEWDVHLWINEDEDTVGLYRIFRDNLSGRWFVDGIYD